MALPEEGPFNHTATITRKALSLFCLQAALSSVRSGVLLRAAGLFRRISLPLHFLSSGADRGSCVFASVSAVSARRGICTSWVPATPSIGWAEDEGCGVGAALETEVVPCSAMPCTTWAAVGLGAGYV